MPFSASVVFFGNSLKGQQAFNHTEVLVKLLSDNYAPLVGDNYAPEKIRVIIPVGGKATRLLPLTAETSKACLRLLNRPLVEFSLLSLASQGIRNFIFGVKGYTNYRDLYDYFESGVWILRKIQHQTPYPHKISA